MFDGNQESGTVVYNKLRRPIVTSYIRFIPTHWNNRISMRIELFGCPGICIRLFKSALLPRYRKGPNLNHFRNDDEISWLLTNFESDVHPNVQTCYDKQENQEINQTEPNRTSWHLLSMTYYTFFLM